jgi:hypothetical protein
MAAFPCTCGHPLSYHHQFNDQPCGFGLCSCRSYSKSDEAKAESVAPNLWGEMQPVAAAFDPLTEEAMSDGHR